MQEQQTVTITVEQELSYIHQRYPGYLECLLPLIEAGKIDGSSYHGFSDCGCFYGHLSDYENTYAADIARLARVDLVGDYSKSTTIETLIEFVVPGETPATNDHLRTLKDAILTVLREEHQIMTTPLTIGGKSPWHEIEQITELAPGVLSISTIAHGGLCIEAELAQAVLSRECQQIGTPFGDYLCYEEDCEVFFPLWEQPGWLEETLRKPVLTHAWEFFSSGVCHEYYPRYNVALRTMHHTYLEDYPEDARAGRRVIEDTPTGLFG